MPDYPVHKQLLEQVLPGWEKEYRFHPTRRWRFDFAHPLYKIAVEIEGGIWVGVGGRHNRASGFLKDMEKYNQAVICGWQLLRFTPDQTAEMQDAVKELLLQNCDGVF